jgi:hypothetical protein
MSTSATTNNEGFYVVPSLAPEAVGAEPRRRRFVPTRAGWAGDSYRWPFCGQNNPLSVIDHNFTVSRSDLRVS